MTAIEIITEMIQNGYAPTANRTPEEWIQMVGDDVEMWEAWRKNFYKAKGIL